MDVDDGLSLNCISHPRPVWWKRPWYWARCLFWGRLSEKSLETIEIEIRDPKS